MEELEKLAEFSKNYADALKAGFDKFTGMLPVLTKQQVRSKAGEKLDTTMDTYMDALNVSMNNYILIVELDEDNWLANAVEGGASPFDMKQTHLKSPKAKLSKPDKYGMRYKYMSIPMGKDPDKKPKNEKEENFQQKIQQVMMRNKFGLKQYKTLQDGTVSEYQKVTSADPDLQGVVRARQFASMDEVKQGKKKPKWNIIKFRTMSERPGTSKWQHPGIEPANILKDTKRWLDQNIDDMLDTFLQNEVGKLL